MSDIKKILSILDETTTAGSVASVPSNFNEKMIKRNDTEILEYGNWENSSLVTNKKLKEKRKTNKVVKSIYGESSNDSSQNPNKEKDKLSDYIYKPDKDGKIVGHTWYGKEKKLKGANIIKHTAGKFYAAGGSSTSIRSNTKFFDTPEAAAKYYHTKKNKVLEENAIDREINSLKVMDNSDSSSKNIVEDAFDLNIGDPVEITGNVQFKGATGDIVGFGQNNAFVIVHLYNYGKHSFHSSDVSFNYYADSDDDETRAVIPDPVPKEQDMAESQTAKSGIVQTDVYGTKAYHAKCMEPGCDWESKRYDRIQQAQAAAKKHSAQHFKKKQGVAEGSDNLNYIGNCTDDDVIEHIFGDATGFAQAVDEYGDEFVLDDLVVKYDPETDIHSFYYKKQDVAEDYQLDEMNPMLVRDGLQVVIDFLSQYPTATALTAGAAGAAAGTAVIAKLVKNAWKNHKELKQLKQDVIDWSSQKLHANKNVSAKGGKVAKIIQAEIDRRKKGVAEGSEDLVQIEYWKQDSIEAGRWVKTQPMPREVAEELLHSHPGAFSRGEIVDVKQGVAEGTRMPDANGNYKFHMYARLRNGNIKEFNVIANSDRNAKILAKKKLIEKGYTNIYRIDIQGMSPVHGPVNYEIDRKLRLEDQGVAEGSELKTFRVMYYNPTTDSNHTRDIKSNNESDVWDRFKSKSLDIISITELGLVDKDGDDRGFQYRDIDDQGVAEGSEQGAHVKYNQGYNDAKASKPSIHKTLTGNDRHNYVLGYKDGLADRKKQSVAEDWEYDDDDDFEGDRLSGRHGMSVDPKKMEPYYPGDKKTAVARTKTNLPTLKKTIRHQLGKHHKPNLPEQGVAEGLDGDIIIANNQFANVKALEEQDLIVNPAGISKKNSELMDKTLDRTDHEIEMALTDLYQSSKNSLDIFNFIKDIPETTGLEGWVQKKIIKAADYLNIVKNYLEGKKINSFSKTNLFLEQENAEPKIRKYTKKRPDGSIMHRWEVLNSKGRRVKEFDSLNLAKDFLRKNKLDLMNGE